MLSCFWKIYIIIPYLYFHIHLRFWEPMFSCIPTLSNTQINWSNLLIKKHYPFHSRHQNVVEKSPLEEVIYCFWMDKLKERVKRIIPYIQKTWYGGISYPLHCRLLHSLDEGILCLYMYPNNGWIMRNVWLIPTSNVSLSLIMYLEEKLCTIYHLDPRWCVNWIFSTTLERIQIGKHKIIEVLFNILYLQIWNRSTGKTFMPKGNRSPEPQPMLDNKKKSKII